MPVRGGKVLVARRDGARRLAGYWEFPGGKTEAGEAPPDAARRELREETGLVAGALEPVLRFVHDAPAARLRFHVFLAPDPTGEVAIDAPRAWGWKTLRQIERLRMPEPNRRMLRALGRRLAR